MTSGDVRPGIPVGARRPPPPSSIVVVVGGQIAPADVAAICDRIGMLLERSEADLVVCDVGALADPDAASLDALCRLQLIARRLGRRAQALDTRGELQDLLVFTGLSGAVPCDDLDLEPIGQPEQREQAGGVQEERDAADPIS